MLHKDSQLTGADVPEYFRNHKSSVFWTIDFSTDGLAHITDWKDKARVLSNFLRDSLPKQPPCHKPAQYLIRWCVMSDGESMWIRFPTRLGGLDFIWYDSKTFRLITGEYTDRAAYYDVQDILDVENDANPVQFAQYLRMLQHMKETGVMPDPAILNGYKCITGNTLEHLFHAIAIGFVEQINKSPTGLGMEMSYSLYPITPERARQNMHLRDGKLDLFLSLHEPVRHHTDLRKTMDMFETRWQRTSKDKKQERYYDIHGYWPDVDGVAHLDYIRTKPFVFAVTETYSKILLDVASCAVGGLYFVIREENNDQAVFKSWFQHEILPDANSFDGTCAFFDNATVCLRGNGQADICLVQDWTEQMIVDAMKHKQKITKHKLEN